MSLFDIIPGYREAVEKEQFVRDSALLGLTEHIGAFEVRMMTLRDYLALRLVRNPFVVGGHPSAEAVMQFLWQLSILKSRRAKIVLGRRCRQFRIPSPPLIHFRRRVERWEVRAVDAITRLGEISKLIQAYVDESTQDWPSGKETECEIAHYGLGVSFCSMLWRDYQWPQEKTLDAPLKVILQYVKEIQAHKGKRTFFSPSSKLRADWLATRN